MFWISAPTDTSSRTNAPHAAVPATGSTTMKKLNKKQLMKKARGQGMTEYIIIVALIAIAAIGVITLFGDNIRKLFGASADALAGEESVTPETRKFKGSAVDAKKTLSTFGTANNAEY
jgi:Flp pilus assembly pilin Flp